ncbi:immunoglobulin domain-containing protein oig-4-like [Limulus polyphemus]|uniref:Immunoglobulin domain-containing protein oig-4-like n=1 Tax=Limulus polyphemus TaxID=6850 RepID=A0ABM1BIQ3_LIMPO|nr:immunoglobulin domain-containing protein oig-4-like [Limulus polyphemus]XP_013782785.1 immunoglobulin domain-containing protein oig-4-like [Limulus polyphemus]XP_022250822.1 immunoglobulin domain-containing protein oig-4-like [Limulus polyphemus]XP_022250823.1 immunoglobulin domain-containing protein oig-4-like [Limulus polyphemus]XP_022250824.1 immunoglobulin domain-containing protein oig-4-like [Limulus polyphemus]
MNIRLMCFLVLLLLLTADSARMRGGRRRGGRRRNRIGSPRFIFYTSPSRREYYDNPNGARILKSSHFDYEFYLGHKIVFLCVAMGDPRPRITWFKNGVELFYHPFFQITERLHGKNKLKSKLEITPATQMDSGTYECQANNKYAVDRRAFKADF